MLSASTLLSFGSLVTSSSFYIICGLLPQGLTRRDGENGSIIASECGAVNIGLCRFWRVGGSAEAEEACKWQSLRWLEECW